MAKRLTIADIIEMDLSKIGPKDIDKITNVFARKAEARLRSFANKKNKNVYSPAVNKIKSKYPEGFPIGDLSFQQKQKLIYNIQDFFRSRTSDVSEARKIARDQDSSLFGEDVFGNPRIRMTRSQRDSFWSAFDEFINQNPVLHDYSDVVRQALASMVEDGTLNKKGDFVGAINKVDMLQKIMGRVNELIENQEAGYGDEWQSYKIFTQRRNDF